MSIRGWWSPDNSFVGIVVMAAAGFATAYGSMYYFELSYLWACVTASVVAILAGILWNIIAHIRGTKKIHWLDFILVDLFPW